MNPMLDFVIMAGAAFLMLLPIVVFLLYHAHKQEKEYKMRAASKMETIPLDYFKDHLGEVLEKVQRGASILISVNDRPGVRLTPAEKT